MSNNHKQVKQDLQALQNFIPEKDTLSQDVVVKAVNSSTFDVFYGIGWNNWCRLQKVIGSKDQFKVVAGKASPAEVFMDFLKQVEQ